MDNQQRRKDKLESGRAWRGAFRRQRFLLGQSATLWPDFPQPWQDMAAAGRPNACEPAEDIEVSWFSLMSFFRLFPASSCAFLRSSSCLLDRLDRARLRSASLMVLRRPRLGSSLPGAGERSSSEASPDSEPEPESESLLPLLSCTFLTACGLCQYSLTAGFPSGSKPALDFFMLNR
jgi:hypothetical protein